MTCNAVKGVLAYEGLTVAEGIDPPTPTRHLLRPQVPRLWSISFGAVRQNRVEHSTLLGYTAPWNGNNL